MDAEPDLTHYLTPAEIYAIAEEVLGRKPDVRDRHLLRSAAKRPALHHFGVDAYPTLLDKAAALLHSLAAHHLFYDGNKRTAARATAVFLAENGLEPTWDADDAYQFILEVAQNQHDVPEIAQWLAANTRPHRQPSSMRYPTLDELIHINEQLPTSDAIHKILKGKQRVRDMALLEAAVLRPSTSAFGQDAYPTPQEKAAALLHSIARNHPFADGNKRTATIAAIFMLEVNGLCVRWNDKEALSQIADIAEGRISVQDFAAWLPTEPCAPWPEPDADSDARTIARIMAERRWLLDELAGR